MKSIALPLTLALALLGGCASIGGLFGSKNEASTIAMEQPAIEKPTVVATPAAQDLQRFGALPGMNRPTYDHFVHWSSKSAPRAFAYSDNGVGAGTHGMELVVVGEALEVGQRALERCRSAGGRNCRLYARNSALVWR